MILALLLASLAFLIQLIYFPSFSLLTLAPLCCKALIWRGRGCSLWVAAWCGLAFDLILADSPFGLCCVCYTLTMALTSCIRKPLITTSFPLLTGSFSALFWLLHHLLFQSHPTLLRAAIHMTIMPVIDGLFAFFWFTCPLILYTRLNETPRFHLRGHPPGDSDPQAKI